MGLVAGEIEFGAVLLGKLAHAVVAGPAPEVQPADGAVAGHRDDAFEQGIAQALMLTVGLDRKRRLCTPGILRGDEADLTDPAQHAIDKGAVNQSVAGKRLVHIGV